MFWLIAILLFFIVGVAVFELIKQDAGYVLISLNGISMETSFWFAIFVLVVVFVVLFCVFVAVKRFFRGFTNSSRWFREKRIHRIEGNYREALLHYLTDDYTSSNRLFSGLSKKSGLPVVKAIASSKSYLKSGDAKKALITLDKAEKDYSEDREWILKAKVLSHIELNNFEQASTDFEELKKINTHDTSLKAIELKLLMMQDGDAELVDRVIDSTLGLPAPESDFLLLNALLSIPSAPDRSEKKVDDLWSRVDKNNKQEPKFQTAYAQALISVDALTQAGKYIEKVLSKQWNADLLGLYAKMEFSGAEMQLKKVEQWKKSYGEYYELFIALGVLAIKNQYWGQARDYLHASLSMQETTQALYLLGYVAEELNEKDESFSYYKRSAALQKL